MADFDTPDYLRIGKRVYKAGGDYRIEGVIAAIVRKRSGAIRYVVETDTPPGLLLIYRAENLLPLEKDGPP